jgi:hypothetical protein
MRRGVLALVVVVVACPGLRAQGRLEQVRREVSSQPSSGKGDGGSSGGSDSGPCEDDGPSLGLGEAWAPLLLAGVLAPYHVPRALLKDDSRTDGYFLPWPYAEDEPGYMCLERGGALKSERSSTGALLSDLEAESWSGRLSLENGNDFSGLNRLNGTLFLDTTLRLGLRTSWHYFNEALDGGRHDDLVLGDTNLTFRFAQHEQAQVYAGLGFRTLAGPGQTHWGWNFTYGADFYPVKPLVISTLLDVGSVGAAGVFHVRATAGLVYERWEVFGGYDFLRIGSVNLQGPLVGVRLWF